MPEAAPIPGPAGPTGAAGAAGAAGPQGPAGPAPAGTGLVSVTAGVLDVPLTLSAGGIVIGGALGVPAVLAAGSAGYVLRMISGAPTWRELSASGLLAARPAATADREGQEYWSTDATAGLELSRCVHQGGGAYAWEVVPYGITATGVAVAQAASGAAALDALRSSTLSVSSTNAAAGTAAGTATAISLTIPTGASVTTTRSDEPSVVLASTGAITRCEVVVRLATVTNSTGAQGLALTIGDDGGSGTLGAGAVLGFRIATNGASDAIRDGSTVVWSNYSAGALTLDGDTWLRMVVGRTGTGAVYTGRGSSRAAVAWTRRWTGDLSTALADNARANVRAAIYVSSGTVPTDITADITSITWTDL